MEITTIMRDCGVTYHDFHLWRKDHWGKMGKKQTLKYSEVQNNKYVSGSLSV